MLEIDGILVLERSSTLYEILGGLPICFQLFEHSIYEITHHVPQVLMS